MEWAILPFLRKHLPDGATPNRGSKHLIAAYYSFIDLKRMKGWVGLVGWPVYEVTRLLPNLSIAEHVFIFQQDNCAPASFCVELQRRETPQFVHSDMWSANSFAINATDYCIRDTERDCRSVYIKHDSGMRTSCRSSLVSHSWVEC